MKKVFLTFLSLVIFSFLIIPNFFAGDPKERRPFTKEEDQKLIELVNKYGKSWKTISSSMGNRSSHSCWARWRNHLSVGDTGKRQHHLFTPEEDQKLIELVKKFGEKGNWGEISSRMENLSIRQCRERWRDFLSVRNTRKIPFSTEEDKIICEKVNEWGPKWTKITKFLPGRSAYDIKRRFINFLMKVHSENYDIEVVTPKPSELNKEFFPNGSETHEFFQEYDNNFYEPYWDFDEF